MDPIIVLPMLTTCQESDPVVTAQLPGSFHCWFLSCVTLV